jgi:hypothetical protein
MYVYLFVHAFAGMGNSMGAIASMEFHRCHGRHRGHGDSMPAMAPMEFPMPAMAPMNLPGIP